MAKYENPAELDYRNGGDTVDDFAQKYMRTVDYIIKALNDLRTPTGNTAGVEPEPYMWRIADNKLYIRNGDNTDYVLLGEISPNFGFRQSVNDRFLTTADLEGDGAVVTRNEAGKVEGDITGSPGKIAGKTIDVTPSADNDVIAYDAAQQKWVKKTLNDYLKKQGDAGWDEMVDEVADQVINDITPIIFNFWYLDDDGYLVPLVGSTEGGLPSIHGMVGDYEQITARSVDVAGNLSATGNITAGMLTTPQANVTTLTANAVNANSASVTEISAGTVTADDVIAKGPVVDVRAFGAKGDGVTDDTAAIQTAIDSGENIFIPAGTYAISQKLNVGARTTLRGESNSKLLFSSVVGLELNGSFIKIERLILECTRSRNDNTLAITDNGNRVASCELKDMEFYQWTTGVDLYSGYNDKIIIDSMYFNTVNNCIKVAHGDGGSIKNIVAEPFINYVMALNSCNAIEVSNVLATGVGADNGYINNPSVVFIVLSSAGASKYDGINVNIHDVYCEKVNTISISNTSFLIIANVFCNNNYGLKDVFKICNPYGDIPKGNINLINVECSTYTGVGIWSPSAAYSETIGDVVITSSLGRPPINVITSSILSYNSISGYKAPRFDCDNVKTFGKGGGIYPDFNNDLVTPPDKQAFSDGDIKFNPSFTNNVNSFSNIVGHIKNSLADNDGWSPIQIGLPTFGKYYLRDSLKGSFEGQFVYNKTDKTFAFWNGEKWCNLSFTILQ